MSALLLLKENISKSSVGYFRQFFSSLYRICSSVNSSIVFPEESPIHLRTSSRYVFVISWTFTLMSIYPFPPSIDEWLSDDHLTRFVFEIVDQLDILTLERVDSGSDAYHPRMMLALLFYCYATGTFSSRKMEAATYESGPVRFVPVNQHLDHNTICTFLRRF